MGPTKPAGVPWPSYQAEQLTLFDPNVYDRRPLIAAVVRAQARYSWRQTLAYQEWRRRILDQRGNRCQVCGSRSRLDVHHNSYARPPGQELDVDVVVLCHTCHSRHHGRRPRDNRP